MAIATWLAKVLRDAGLKVIEQPDWKDRGLGDFTFIKGVIAHHTGPGSVKGLVNLVQNGRSDLRGPLSQLVLGPDGTYYVIASGRSNHAGRGTWQGITSGNSQMIGIEAVHPGDASPWPEEQMKAYIKGVAAILGYLNVDSVMVCGHKEWALPRGRKPDPTFDMIAFRIAVEEEMNGVDSDIKPAPVNPTYSMLRKGDRGESVKTLQRALDILADGIFGPMTEKAVKAFQRKKGLVADGLVGPKTWAALGYTNKV